MRGLIWTWRLVLAVTIGAFVATAYYITHGEPDSMDSAMPALNLITVIGAALLGIMWTLSRHYWHTLILLIALGVQRGLFESELLTEFQGIYVLVSIGVIGFVFVVTLTARALINDRALKAAKAATAYSSPMETAPVGIPVPAPPVPAPTTQEVTAAQPVPKPAAKSAPKSTAKSPGGTEDTAD